jgi:hypothetical protein
LAPPSLLLSARRLTEITVRPPATILARLKSREIIHIRVSLFWFWRFAIKMGFVIAYDRNQPRN